jgi:hypothetical protein
MANETAVLSAQYQCLVVLLLRKDANATGPFAYDTFRFSSPGGARIGALGDDLTAAFPELASIGGDSRAVGQYGGAMSAPKFDSKVDLDPLPKFVPPTFSCEIAVPPTDAFWQAVLRDREFLFSEAFVFLVSPNPAVLSLRNLVYSGTMGQESFELKWGAIALKVSHWSANYDYDFPNKYWWQVAPLLAGYGGQFGGKNTRDKPAQIVYGDWTDDSAQFQTPLGCFGGVDGAPLQAVWPAPMDPWTNAGYPVICKLSLGDTAACVRDSLLSAPAMIGQIEKCDGGGSRKSGFITCVNPAADFIVANYGNWATTAPGTVEKYDPSDVFYAQSVIGNISTGDAAMVVLDILVRAGLPAPYIGETIGTPYNAAGQAWQPGSGSSAPAYWKRGSMAGVCPYQVRAFLGGDKGGKDKLLSGHCATLAGECGMMLVVVGNQLQLVINPLYNSDAYQAAGLLPVTRYNSDPKKFNATDHSASWALKQLFVDYNFSPRSGKYRQRFPPELTYVEAEGLTDRQELYEAQWLWRTEDAVDFALKMDVLRQQYGATIKIAVPLWGLAPTPGYGVNVTDQQGGVRTTIPAGLGPTPGGLWVWVDDPTVPYSLKAATANASLDLETGETEAEALEVPALNPLTATGAIWGGASNAANAEWI